eukprot:TRINITY_DN72577_c0_g1_i1.p1 TRINITY_DN72577_c0_g1~~TRINITY_DN72577_c0_g1_i1.p1  ORF type:complete len:527 (-),score=105.84 TRINITY_DN72577_c0_g1_i1:70-1650(-)
MRPPSASDSDRRGFSFEGGRGLEVSQDASINSACGAEIAPATAWRLGAAPLLGSQPLRTNEDGDTRQIHEARAEVRSGRCKTFVHEKLFWVLFMLTCLACALSLLILWATESPHFKLALVLESIPIVSVLFTWAHIWLAVQMMFYPVCFRGLWNYKQSGYGLGWQGVVPRKAGVMAERSCELMVGRLITMEEIVDRFHVDEFFETLGAALLDCSRNVNEKLGAKYFPELWTRIPQTVKEEILEKTLEIQGESFGPIMADVRSNITTILNVKDMCVKRYTEEPTLLIELFQQVGRKEFEFIRRCGAQMGLLLGLAQMGLYFVTKSVPWMPWVMLPLSGLIIGNFTNWLAIQLIFKPTYPQVYFRGLLTVQGLFLKRQKQVARELASMLADTCVNAEMMIRYIVSSPGYEGALEIFDRHTSKACDEVLGYARTLVPVAVGSERWTNLKHDVMEGLLEELRSHAPSFLKYADQALHIEETIASRLANLPPDQFEGMLHPAFQEDEWMLILLGGVLGVVVGLFQAAVLRT